MFYNSFFCVNYTDAMKMCRARLDNSLVHVLNGFFPFLLNGQSVYIINLGIALIFGIIDEKSNYHRTTLTLLRGILRDENMVK